MGLERRGCVVQPRPRANWRREEPVDKVKPFDIPKREVWEAFKRVKANQGAAGVDGQSIAEFEANLSGNLYRALLSTRYFCRDWRQEKAMSGFWLDCDCGV
jgi:retron-type reverse transcriptase